MNKRKLLYWILAGILSFSIPLTYLLYKRSPNPADEIRLANTRIMECVSLNGENFASATLSEARRFYDSANISWEAENRKWILFRDYSFAHNYAIQAQSLAEKAIKESQRNEKQMRHDLQLKITKLKNEISLFDSVLNRLPMSKREQQDLHKGKLLYHEGIKLFEQGNLRSAGIKIHSSYELLEPQFNKLKQKLYEYFEGYSHWKKNLEATLRWSKENNTRAIIVDKFSRKLILIEKGVPVAEYPVELGRNPIDDKAKQGDFATPEGRYEVLKKKSGIHTRYHKALLIDYPNHEDKINFHNKIKSGAFSPEEKIGGSIEIHGHGGKGGDWTEGCVALTNGNMDAVYNFARVGTKVTIAGSIKPLSDFLPGEK